MESLYLTHFGLRQEPFNVTPDPGFLYLSASHREAFAQLSYGVKARKGFVVLTGEVGTGKTTLIHALLNEINGETQTALLFNTVASPEDLLRYVCEDFGLMEVERDHRGMHDYLTLLNRFLLESYRKGHNVALIIDEAQNLSAEVLESIRLLSNFETSRDKLLQIVLVGQPELAVRLNSAELRQLKQRVALRHHLLPLSLAECQEYIRSRLVTAGGELTIFSGKALDAIYRYSSGIPRLVNVLCDNSMLTAYALERREVDAAMIQEVAEDLNLNRASVPKAHLVQGSDGGEQGMVRTIGTSLGAVRSAKTPLDLSQDKASLSAFGSDVVPRAFLERMVSALTEAMGPVAPLVVREQIGAFHERKESSPLARLKELIAAASQEVLDERLRARFQKQMEAELQRVEAEKVKP